MAETMPDEIRPVTPDAEARARLIAAAREATGKLRDAARLGTIIEFRQRDELVVAIHRALDLLAAEGWRDISTAPKDGSEVLVWGGRYGTRGPVVAHFMRQAPEDHPPIDPGWYFWQPHTSTRYGSFIQLDTPPTHWMPLPSPPGGSR